MEDTEDYGALIAVGHIFRWYCYAGLIYLIAGAV